MSLGAELLADEQVAKIEALVPKEYKSRKRGRSDNVSIRVEQSVGEIVIALTEEASHMSERMDLCSLAACSESHSKLCLECLTVDNLSNCVRTNELKK